MLSIFGKCSSYSGLYIKKDKFYFSQERIGLLGYVIGIGQIRMESEKIRAIQEWKAPIRLRELCYFPGLVNYY